MLTAGAEDDALALVIQYLSEAFGHLAAEPPRTRCTDCRGRGDM